MTGHQDISHLLHDARLIDVEWTPELALLRLVYNCLRRNVDGSPIEDSAVELDLEGVSALATYYSPAEIKARPSQFVVRTVLTESHLRSWSHPPVEAPLSVNSRNAAIERQTACRVDWLVGAEDELEDDESVLDVHLEFGFGFCAADRVSAGLFVRCRSIRPMAGGVPFDLDDWRSQFEAWWLGWREHWTAKGDDDEEEDISSVLEDTFIPAGEDPPPDLSYRPPNEPPFLLADCDAPEELLAPVRDLHEGLQSRNWRRMAEAYPDFDVSEEERAQWLEEHYLNLEFGRWVYVRRIDFWWQEERRACVVARGIEHRMPAEGEPASDEETVITYGLRKHEGRWIIWKWSQGWPRHGSAPELEEP